MSAGSASAAAAISAVAPFWISFRNCWLTRRTVVLLGFGCGLIGAIGARKRRLFRLTGRSAGGFVGSGALGVYAELDEEVDKHRHRLAVFHRGRKRGFTDGSDGIFVKAETDGPPYRNFSGLAVCAHHHVVLRHA